MIDLTAFQEARVAVLGSEGLLGSAVSRLLRKIQGDSHPDDRISPVELLDCDELAAAFASWEPDYILNLAGFNGGVGFQRPFSIFDRNITIPLNVLRAAAGTCPTAKILMPVASCAYGEPETLPPGIAQLDGMFDERDFLRGNPNPTVEAHGYAKRAVQLACRYARREYGVHAVTVCPPTCFGIDDRYGPDRSKVMAATIKRFADAADEGLAEVTCWGDGSPLREYLYADDCASLLLQALLAYDDSDIPLNVGCGVEWTVRETAEKVAALAGYKGRILWDKNRPNGQHRKRLNLSRMDKVLGPQSLTPFDEALAKTIDDYRARKKEGTLR